MSGRQWLGIGWAPWSREGGRGATPPPQFPYIPGGCPGPKIGTLSGPFPKSLRSDLLRGAAQPLLAPSMTSAPGHCRQSHSRTPRPVLPALRRGVMRYLPVAVTAQARDLGSTGVRGQAECNTL